MMRLFRPRSLAYVAFAGALGLAVPQMQAGAQTSFLISVEQIPSNVSSSTLRRSAPAPLSKGRVDTRLPAVPPQMVDACAKAQANRSEPPKGIDCKPVLDVLAARTRPVRRTSPEEALLGIAPSGMTVVTTQRTNLPDAEAVARRLGSGDVQGSPIAEAVGAITPQQQAQGTPPK